MERLRHKTARSNAVDENSTSVSGSGDGISGPTKDNQAETRVVSEDLDFDENDWPDFVDLLAGDDRPESSGMSSSLVASISATSGNSPVPGRDVGTQYEAEQATIELRSYSQRWEPAGPLSMDDVALAMISNPAEPPSSVARRLARSSGLNGVDHEIVEAVTAAIAAYERRLAARLASTYEEVRFAPNACQLLQQRGAALCATLASRPTDPDAASAESSSG